MKKNIRDLVKEWPKCFIQESDLAMLLNDKTDDARHSLIKRTLKNKVLIRLRRGLYLIADKMKPMVDEFELSMLIYGPSFVSLESALSYHGWIPETVYATTCVTTKRAKKLKTSIGIFSYEHVPLKEFYVGIDRIETVQSVFFIATPWRALADFMYVTRRSWKTLFELELDLRIDVEDAMNSDKEMLRLLIEKYPSRRVCDNLKKFLKEIKKTLKANV